MQSRESSRPGRSSKHLKNRQSIGDTRDITESQGSKRRIPFAEGIINFGDAKLQTDQNSVERQKTETLKAMNYRGPNAGDKH